MLVRALALSLLVVVGLSGTPQPAQLVVFVEIKPADPDTAARQTVARDLGHAIPAAMRGTNVRLVTTPEGADLGVYVLAHYEPACDGVHLALSYVKHPGAERAYLGTGQISLQSGTGHDNLVKLRSALTAALTLAR